MLKSQNSWYRTRDMCQSLGMELPQVATSQEMRKLHGAFVYGQNLTKIWIKVSYNKSLLVQITDFGYLRPTSDGVPVNTSGQTAHQWQMSYSWVATRAASAEERSTACMLIGNQRKWLTGIASNLCTQSAFYQQVFTTALSLKTKK